MSAWNANGWFAGDDEDQTNTEYRWRPVLQLDGWVVTCQGPWFASEQECIDFIAQDIIGKGLHPDYRTEWCPTCGGEGVCAPGTCAAQS